MAGTDSQPTPEPQHRYLTLLEFSALTGLSPATVRRYLKSGKLRYLQPAGPRGRILIPADTLESTMATGHGTPLDGTPAETMSAPAKSQRQEPSAKLSGPRPSWTRRLGPRLTGEE
jgi:hypothetical protein